ncbi:MAG: hypothetical protein JNM36_14735 [Chitinophagales bacterium]|nr:hypothetical protein [Chitinophagales bacterium]
MKTDILMKIAVILIGLVFFFWFYLAIIDFVNSYHIATKGQIVVGVIVKTPKFCGKNSRISINYHNEIDELEIGSFNCNQQKYLVGDSIKIQYLHNYGMKYPNTHSTTWVFAFKFLILLGFGGTAFFCLIAPFKYWE